MLVEGSFQVKLMVLGVASPTLRWSFSHGNLLLVTQYRLCVCNLSWIDLIAWGTLGRYSMFNR